MTELQRYLAEEVAEDHADGIITRREAVRRLGLLGVTGAAATAMLAAPSAAAPAGAGKRGREGSLRGARDVEWSPVATEAITFPGPRGTLMAAWAAAERPRGGVLVIHENRGLNDHIRSVAGRFAASGYSALAIDLLSEEGGTGAFPGEAEVAAKLAEISATAPERFADDMKAGVTELEGRVGRKEVAATGFCFGGGMVWLLLTSGERRLAAAAPFYGPFPAGGEISRSNTAVLGIYAGLDDRVNATREAARAAIEAARLKYQFVTFTDAGHAFFNEGGARFHPAAMAESNRRVLDWFDRFVARHGGEDDDD
jgi:carboxymethylenebutenolidase